PSSGFRGVPTAGGPGLSAAGRRCARGGALWRRRCATMMAVMATEDNVDRLRAELEEWRRRAEVAEAVAAERLARAETAEGALRAAEAALTAARGWAGQLDAGLPPPPPPERPRPASLLERWRRYTDTIN